MQTKLARPSGKRLTAKQKKLLTFMLHGYNRTQLLALVQIDSNTYSRWLKEPHFKKALEKLTA